MRKSQLDCLFYSFHRIKPNVVAHLLHSILLSKYNLPICYTFVISNHCFRNFFDTTCYLMQINLPSGFEDLYRTGNREYMLIH
jgi:hypothetical protein